ncbi:MAG: PQQ-dependent sugar dehydrogenase [Phaeodactylibacter sp.]|uniref:PQQ-dependent sugar dehydrogenase n=1 Tax=Phaeodactylibacter sp. TaxID=1940289 RepID=UPI0032EFCEF9
MRTILTFAFITMAFYLFGQPAFNLELVLQGLSQPADITHAEDDRLFIVERNGRIRILDATGALLPQPFLDINDRVSPASGERGLLGLAFHPDYAENGYFFVNYTANSGATRIVKFQVDPANPNAADPDSEVVLFQISQPYSNHNAGDLAFGPDGYLYIPMGDGGSGGDPQNFSQNRQSLLGKMLRIDVDSGDPYSIPADNPFVDDDSTLDEIWAVGLRNPWRFSFDRETGDIWIGDVGQNAWEEITFQPAGSEGGENYGWRCYEGFETYNTSGCEPEGAYTPPIHTYATGSSDGCSVTGGFVYRGSAFPAMYGKYLYADFCSGKVWMLEKDFAGNWVNTEIFDGPGGEYATFGQDSEGELYLAELINGRLHRVEATCNQSPAAPIISGDAIICGPDAPAVLNAGDGTDGYIYRWYQDSVELQETLNGTLSVSEPGIYHVVLAGFEAGNCNSPVSTAFIVEAADFPTDLISTQGDDLSAAPGFESYQWFLNGEPIEGATTATYTPQSSGTYTVEVTAANGCTRLSEGLAIVSTTLDLGLAEVRATPNPFRSTLDLYLEAIEADTYQLRLLTVDGKLVWEQAARVQTAWQQQLDLSSQAAGVYLLQISRDEQQYTRKLIKGE